MGSRRQKQAPVPTTIPSWERELDADSNGRALRPAGRGDDLRFARSHWSRYSDWANRHQKWVLAAPAMLFVLGLLLVPLGWTLFLSFTDATGSVRNDFGYVGFRNYAEVLTDTRRFWPSVWRTLLYTVGSVAAETTLGLGIALLLKKPFRASRFFNGVILLPLVATPVAVAMMWLLILDPNIGFANYVLEAVGLPRLGWVSNTATALPSLIMIDIWQWTPMMALIILAGLVSLPTDPDEAAQIDGANAFQRFRYVTLPLVMPTLVIAVILRSIQALKAFAVLFAAKGMGGGSQHEAETIDIYAYTVMFGHNRYGIASTILVIFLLVILAVVSILFIARKRSAVEI